MILVETNMSNAENDLYMINGYNSIFINRKRRGGDIAVYTNIDSLRTTATLNSLKAFR